jgi:hypothetical protein
MEIESPTRTIFKSVVGQTVDALNNMATRKRILRLQLQDYPSACIALVPGLFLASRGGKRMTEGKYMDVTHQKCGCQRARID